MAFDAFDVVVTPFPFADKAVERRRPALVLSPFESYGRLTGVATIAMITTGRASQWPLDVPVTDLEAAGLPHPCVVRMKLATVDFRRLGPKLGRLAPDDRGAVVAALGRLLPVG